MNKKIAVLQSNYIPWKGYFDIIDSVDEFIIYDTVQYTKRDWRNRNRIKTDKGIVWLTIPVNVKGKFEQKIQEVSVQDGKWALKHWKSIAQNYSRAQYFNKYKDVFEGLYIRASEMNNLSEINKLFITGINNVLGISTVIKPSSGFSITGKKSDAIISICKQAGANVYLSGPAAKCYIDENLFTDENIQVEWMSYDFYREYNQLYGQFDHYVSVLDLIFNTGEKAIDYIRNKEKNGIL